MITFFWFADVMVAELYVSRHIHLHIVSSDLCSEKLKHKKHYNSFHPKLGFFLHLDEVLSWFDTESDSYFATVRLSAVSGLHYKYVDTSKPYFRWRNLTSTNMSPY